MRGKNECRGCRSTDIFQALDLGYSPLANRVIPEEMLESAEPWFPLVLRICRNCNLGQLGEFATDGAIFRDYPYLSSTSSTWLEENKKFADEMIELLKMSADDLVIELASNDGYLLQYFMDRQIKVLGVEPALNVATIAAVRGIPTSPEFFSESLAGHLRIKEVHPKLIVAKNVLAHVPDMRDFLKGVSVLSGESTLVVVEAPSILNIIQKMQFDTIYHEHFSYLSATFLEAILPEFGMKLVGVENVNTHGGSLRCYITKIESSIIPLEKWVNQLESTLSLEKQANFDVAEVWLNLESQVNDEFKKIREWLSHPEGRIIGYGAAAKVVTLLSAAQIPRGLISLCIDNSEEKMNRYIPGSHIKIVSESDYIDNHRQPEDIYVIFPWNIQKEISSRIRVFNPSARIFVLLPSVKEL
jgi:hypothetical protein